MLVLAAVVISVTVFMLVLAVVISVTAFIRLFQTTYCWAGKVFQTTCCWAGKVFQTTYCWAGKVFQTTYCWAGKVLLDKPEDKFQKHVEYLIWVEQQMTPDMNSKCSKTPITGALKLLKGELEKELKDSGSIVREWREKTSQSERQMSGDFIKKLERSKTTIDLILRLFLAAVDACREEETQHIGRTEHTSRTAERTTQPNISIQTSGTKHTGRTEHTSKTAERTTQPNISIQTSGTKHTSKTTKLTIQDTNISIKNVNKLVIINGNVNLNLQGRSAAQSYNRHQSRMENGNQNRSRMENGNQSPMVIINGNVNLNLQGRSAAQPYNRHQSRMENGNQNRSLMENGNQSPMESGQVHRPTTKKKVQKRKNGKPQRIKEFEKQERFHIVSNKGGKQNG